LFGGGTHPRIHVRLGKVAATGQRLVDDIHDAFGISMVVAIVAVIAAGRAGGAELLQLLRAGSQLPLVLFLAGGFALMELTPGRNRASFGCHAGFVFLALAAKFILPAGIIGLPHPPFPKRGVGLQQRPQLRLLLGRAKRANQGFEVFVDCHCRCPLPSVAFQLPAGSGVGSGQPMNSLPPLAVGGRSELCPGTAIGDGVPLSGVAPPVSSTIPCLRMFTIRSAKGANLGFIRDMSFRTDSMAVACLSVAPCGPAIGFWLGLGTMRDAITCSGGRPICAATSGGSGGGAGRPDGSCGVKSGIVVAYWCIRSPVGELPSALRFGL